VQVVEMVVVELVMVVKVFQDWLVVIEEIHSYLVEVGVFQGCLMEVEE